MLNRQITKKGITYTTGWLQWCWFRRFLSFHIFFSVFTSYNTYYTKIYFKYVFDSWCLQHQDITNCKLLAWAIYVSNMLSIVNNLIFQFADDAKMFRNIRSDEDFHLLQHDVNMFFAWSKNCNWSLLLVSAIDYTWVHLMDLVNI